MTPPGAGTTTPGDRQRRHRSSSRLFVISIDSAREIDLDQRRIRRLDGIRSATPREGEREWRSYTLLSPDPPAPSQPVRIVWAIEGGVYRSTQTSSIVAAVWEDPTAGPFAWTGEDMGVGASPGTVLVGGAAVRTTTAAAAHTLAALANIGHQWTGFSAPEPLWGIAPARPDGEGPGEAAITVGGAAVAVGAQEPVRDLYDALLRLPPDVNLPMGAFSAATRATWSPAPITRLPEAGQRQALGSAGLTEEEIDSVPDLGVLVAAAANVAELMTWGAVGRWLRAPHATLDGASPLATLAGGGDVAPALRDPFGGGDPPETTWEPEAWACYRAAKSAGWTWAELARDIRDGRWTVRGIRTGVRIGIFDTVYGPFATADIADDPEGDAVALDGPIDPTAAPAELVRRVDEWMEDPQHKKLALARALRLTATSNPA